MVYLSGACLLRLSWKKRPWDHLGEPVPEETFTHSHSSLICFLHLLQSMASSLFNLCVWQSFCTVCVQVFFGLPVGLAPSSSYSIHFFTQSLSVFHSTCPYHHNMFCCSTEIMSSNPSFSLNPLFGTLSCSLMPCIHLTIFISAHWSAASFSFLTGHVTLPVTGAGHTSADIGVNANLELVDKFCYLGDMLSVVGDADVAVEARIRIIYRVTY